MLKALEGALSSIMAAVERALTATDELAAHFEPIRPALDDLYERLEPESFGGAMLLGVDGVCIISHGSSSAKAVFNAIKMAREMVVEEVVEELRAAVAARLTEGRPGPAAATLSDAPPRNRRPSVPAETHVEQGPLDRNAIFEIVRDRLADILEIDPGSISEGQSFVDDLDADSLALIELVEALEEELGERSVGFRIEDEDLADLKSVRDAVDYVYERVKES